METKELSGAAKDVMHALFFRGALASGDLPSKCGAAELRDSGLAETRHFATSFGGEDYFTFLSPDGQKCAIGFFVDGKFGQ
ncbi:hypothetical protein [Serratia fonticola]|uniref:hypothetical protein n=1 Tax=Serratia fonticola TaxID=47917 RepID=UPI003AAEB7F0|nr:hypothetical protein [Serratia fonticola]HBE9093202.1 hypothetical protein [Serratia fonticola]